MAVMRAIDRGSAFSNNGYACGRRCACNVNLRELRLLIDIPLKEVVECGPQGSNRRELSDFVPCRSHCRVEDIGGEFELKCHCQPTSKRKTHLVFLLRWSPWFKKKDESSDSRFKRRDRDNQGSTKFDTSCEVFNELL
jgi:hypothetical protein